MQRSFSLGKYHKMDHRKKWVDKISLVTFVVW